MLGTDLVLVLLLVRLLEQRNHRGGDWDASQRLKLIENSLNLLLKIKETFVKMRKNVMKQAECGRLRGNEGGSETEDANQNKKQRRISSIV